ncbi:mechanosensitive ion channel family protein [Agarivorans sp. MS3-6]|uniref:mechanosensitive ion channel family protein n=1 Tax=Agarivorans sp. TSD2052 TaxID=2937286 RepID=UPI00200BDAE8|nr:mechanosensitive ion channel domain-containing protein [Agarivorans sp. TSD2052]UPW19950.1 mechanosensitive ion channel [Agarivorans sp. TSD2052]
MNIDKINEVLAIPVFTIQDKAISLGDILLIPFLLLLSYLTLKTIIKLLVRRMTRKGVTPDVIHLVSRIAYILGIVIVLVMALELINIPITAFAFLSGAIAIGVGFGAQNIINNFISGWILMWERPIKIGDFLEVDGVKGNVEAINTRSTRIRRTDGVHLLIPNSKLLENTVINWTLIDTRTRTTINVGVAYGSPCRQVALLIEQAVKEQEAVLSQPAPTVVFNDFGDNALAFVVYFWVEAQMEGQLRQVSSEIRFRIDELFAEHDIIIAFPQRDIHLDGALTISHAQQTSSTVA